MTTQLLTYRKRKATTQVILHDSHTLPDQMNMAAWLRVNARKLGLLDVGYHYVIFPDGKLLETRPHDTVGSHCSGHNEDSIGVCLIGGRREVPGEDGEVSLRIADTFTDAQKETLRWLYHTFLTPAYGSLSLRGHSESGREHRGLCPATNMEKLRTWLLAPSCPPSTS